MLLLAGFGRRLWAQAFAPLSSARQAGRRAARRPGDALAGQTVRGRWRDALERRDAESADSCHRHGRPDRRRRQSAGPIRGGLRALSPRRMRCRFRAGSEPRCRRTSRTRSGTPSTLGLRLPVSQQHVQGRGRRAAGRPGSARSLPLPVTSVTDAAVEIAEVEEDVLIFV